MKKIIASLFLFASVGLCQNIYLRTWNSSTSHATWVLVDPNTLSITNGVLSAKPSAVQWSEVEDYFVVPSTGQQVFTTSKTVAPNTIVKVFRNGVRQYPTVDFNVASGSAYAVTFSVTLTSGDAISLDYFTIPTAVVAKNLIYSVGNAIFPVAANQQLYMSLLNAPKGGTNAKQ